MAKKTSTEHKKGDVVTSTDGKKYTYTEGGHWRGEDGKLFNNGNPGDPTAAASGDGPGNRTYQDALGDITGSDISSNIKKVQAQVGTGEGHISQASADAEISRLRGLSDTGSTGLSTGLKDIAGGDAKIEAGFKGGAEIGSSLFAPGSLGRVDENASKDQLDIQQQLKDRAAPNVDPLLQGSLDRANKTADDAQTLSPELQNVLDLRKKALGGLNTDELTATKELAQGGFDQSLTSAVRALRVGQGGSGPSGRAANIQTIPLTAQFANSQADLQRKLVLDQYNAQTDARNAYSTDAQAITGQFDANRINANTAAGNAASTALTDRSARYNNYVGYNTALRNDLYSRQLQNLNTVAAEKSGQAASIFGGGAFAAQQEGQQQSFELGKQNLELQKDIFKSGAAGSSGSESGGDNNSPGNGNEDTFG